MNSVRGGYDILENRKTVVAEDSTVSKASETRMIVQEPPNVEEEMRRKPLRRVELPMALDVSTQMCRKWEMKKDELELLVQGGK